MLIAWLAAGVTTLVETQLEDTALSLVNAINTATDGDELIVVLPKVERWVARSRFHARAYLRADAQLAQWEQLYDAKSLPPMTASEAREQEPLPVDSSHNVEARRHIRALCEARVARLRQSEDFS